MVDYVNKALKLVILPDDDMIPVLEQNMGNARFVWNKILSVYTQLYELSKSGDFSISPSISILNKILMKLKSEYPFLREGESTSQQQVFRDLNKAFTNFFKHGFGYPQYKSKRNSKQSFRIQKVGNNIKITNKRIGLAKLGYVKYRTSKEYRKLLKSSKINNVTVKRENGKYYAVVNIKTTVEEFEKTGKQVGIDLGLKSLATLSNGQVIANLDLKREEEMIKKYQTKLSRQKYMGQNYKKTLQKYYKWQNRKNNKINNAYHHISKYLVKTFDLIVMEDLNIKGMIKNKKLSHKIHTSALHKLTYMIKYKAQWYSKEFKHINRFFPSSKKCNNCGYIKKDLTLDIRKWFCPSCNTHHDRDINAAINILNEGKKNFNIKNN